MTPIVLFTLTAFSLLAGALLVLAPYLNFGPSLDRLAQRLRRLTSDLRPLFRYPELGGYVHDTAMSFFIPPGACHYVTGTWTDAAGAVAGTIAKSKAAADQVGTITIPILVPQNSVALKGSYVKSIDVWWEVLTAAMDAVTATVSLATLPADTAAFAAPAAQVFTYDSGNDTAPKRLTLARHKMTLTLTTPIWLDDDHELLIALTMDAAATSAITFFGARANVTLRL